MPDLRDSKWSGRVLSVVFALMSTVMWVLTLVDYGKPNYVSGMNLVSFLVAVIGFAFFLDSRKSWQLFWVVTCFTVCFGFGSCIH